MDLTRFDFGNLGREKKIDPLHLARECVQLEVLHKLSSSDLRRVLCFKGGTALHMIFNMDRYSEDLDFSLSANFPAEKILSLIKELLKDEDVTDFAIKRKTVLVEMRQSFKPYNFRVKLEINTDNIVPAELKTLYSEFEPASFNLQIMRTDHLIAQKIRAFVQRKKGRDLYDLWFILRTKLPIDIQLVSKLTDMPSNKVYEEIEKRVSDISEKQLASDLNPFINPTRRAWAKKDLKNEVVRLLLALETLQGL